MMVVCDVVFPGAVLVADFGGFLVFGGFCLRGMIWYFLGVSVLRGCGIDS